MLLLYIFIGIVGCLFLKSYADLLQYLNKISKQIKNVTNDISKLGRKDTPQ